MELFAPYLHDNGVIKRLTQYKNLDHTDEIACWQWYRNREDALELVEKDFETNQIIENYAIGRPDALCREYLPSIPHYIFCQYLFDFFNMSFDIIGYVRSMERDGEKTFEYYDNSRLDGLLKLHLKLGATSDHVREYFEYRQDR